MSIMIRKKEKRKKIRRVDLDKSGVDLVKFIKNSNAIEGIYDDSEIPFSILAWEYLIKQPQLNTATILKVHYLIMKNLNPRIAGKIRDCNVMVGGRICPKFHKVKGMLTRWVKRYGKGVKTEGQAQWAHVDFERIHGFRDGNGRTGRLLWLWHREKAGFPFMYIDVAQRYEYYKWFEEKENIKEGVEL